MALLPQPKEFRDFLDAYPSLQAIGNTPMVKLDLPLDMGSTEVFAKYEQLNPGGSIKDRPVLRMLAEAMMSGELSAEKTILDSTSGNAGIAYAMIGATLGCRVQLVMPANASEERKKRIRAHGADIVLTDPLLGYDESLREVRRRFEEDPGGYFFCDQYKNNNNWRAHYEGTAEEVLAQTPDITHFVAGVGTGGTITGVGRRLKKEKPEVKVICIVPGDWRGVEGLKPLGEGAIVPEILDESIIDERIDIDVDAAHDMSRLLASRGIFVGQSSGAYLQGACQVAQRERGGRIVTVFNDIGERYFSTGMWD